MSTAEHANLSHRLHVVGEGASGSDQQQQHMAQEPLPAQAHQHHQQVNRQLPHHHHHHHHHTRGHQAHGQNAAYGKFLQQPQQQQQHERSASMHEGATAVKENVGHATSDPPAGTHTLLQKLASVNEQTWIQTGNLAELMGDHDLALRAYESALRHNPYSIPALTQLATLCRSAEQFGKAVDFFNRLLKIDNANGEFWGTLGHCYLMMDELQQAYAAYQQALYYLPNPKEPKLWYGIGILYDRYGSLDHAEEAFAAVMQMDPKFEKANEIYFRLGIIYKQLGKFDLSLQCFHYILRNPPRPLTELDIWFQIGHVHEQQKDYVAAKDVYERVLSQNPTHAKILQQLGWLYSQAKAPFCNQEMAVQYLTRSLNVDSNDAQSWYLLGRCYMAEQNHTRAYEAYQQAVYRDGRNPTFWCSIGVLYYQINQYRDALDAYSRAIRLNPYIAEVWYDLGTLYESCNNQTVDAIDAYQRAEQLDPGNMHIKQRLQMLRQGLSSGPSAPPPQEMHSNANSLETPLPATHSSVPRLTGAPPDAVYPRLVPVAFDGREDRRVIAAPSTSAAGGQFHPQPPAHATDWRRSTSPYSWMGSYDKSGPASADKRRSLQMPGRPVNQLPAHELPRPYRERSPSLTSTTASHAYQQPYHPQPAAPSPGHNHLQHPLQPLVPPLALASVPPPSQGYVRQYQFRAAEVPDVGKANRRSSESRTAAAAGAAGSPSLSSQPSTSGLHVVSHRRKMSCQKETRKGSGRSVKKTTQPTGGDPSVSVAAGIEGNGPSPPPQAPAPLQDAAHAQVRPPSPTQKKASVHSSTGSTTSRPQTPPPKCMEDSTRRSPTASGSQSPTPQSPLESAPLSRPRTPPVQSARLPAPPNACPSSIPSSHTPDNPVPVALPLPPQRSTLNSQSLAPSLGESCLPSAVPSEPVEAGTQTVPDGATSLRPSTPPDTQLPRSPPPLPQRMALFPPQFSPPISAPLALAAEPSRTSLKELDDRETALSARTDEEEDEDMEEEIEEESGVVVRPVEVDPKSNPLALEVQKAKMEILPTHQAVTRPPSSPTALPLPLPSQ